MKRCSAFAKPVQDTRAGMSRDTWEDRDSYVAKIEANGGTIISEPGEGALKFRAPDGTVAEIVGAGRYNKKKAEKAPA